jgi:hypothetical protein
MRRDGVEIYSPAFTHVVPDNTIGLVVVSVGVFVVTSHQYSFFERGPSADSPPSSSLFFFPYQIPSPQSGISHRKILCSCSLPVFG